MSVKEKRHTKRIVVMCENLMDLILRLHYVNKPITDKFVAKNFKVSVHQARAKLDEVCVMGYAARKSERANKVTYQLLPPSRPVHRYKVMDKRLIVQLTCGHTKGISQEKVSKPNDRYRCDECLKNISKGVNTNAE